MVIRAGVIGQPVKHSLSPRIHNYWFKQTGLDGHYEAVEASAEEFEPTVRRLAAEGWAGLNVTFPHKAAAFALADHQNYAARKFEAANVLMFRDGNIIADNTDGEGFQKSLYPSDAESQEALNNGTRTRPYFMDARQQRAILLGAGGASAAALKSLIGYKEIIVVNRSVDKAQRLIQHYGAKARTATWSELPELLPDTHMLVNCTSLGMKGQPELPVDISSMPKNSRVVDIVYNPLKTDLLKQAEALGFWTRNGLHMLVEQAAPSFTKFTGVDLIDTDTIMKLLLADLA